MKIIFILTFIYLIYLSYQDLKSQEINNRHIAVLFILGVSYNLLTKDLFSTGLIMILMGIFSYMMWNKSIIGGADMKLLIVLSGLLSSKGLGNNIASLIFFIIFFGICGSIYGYLYNKLFGETGNVPFIPVITLSYALSLWFKIY
jgi:Flp pilus assembly protein protease CpaA